MSQGTRHRHTMSKAYLSGGRAGLLAYSIEQLSSRAGEAGAVQLAMLHGEPAIWTQPFST